MSSSFQPTVMTPSVDKSADTLLQALMFVTRFYKKAVSEESVTHGLPMEEGTLMTPALMIRAAKRAGFKCAIMKRDLSEISPHVLPAVLFLKNKTACVLLSAKIDTEKNTLRKLSVYFPISNETQEFLSVDDFLNAHAYSGHAAFFKDEGEAAGGAIIGAGVHGDSLKNSSSWFWDTIKQFKKVYTQVALAAIFINLMALVAPLFIMNVYDRVVPNAAYETLWVLALGAFIAYVFDFVLRTLRGYFIDIAGKGADILLAGRIFQQVLNIRLGLNGASAGAFANQLRDYENLRDFFTSATLVTLIDLPFVLLFVLIIGLIGGPIALIPLVAIPLVLLVNLAIQKPIRDIMQESSDLMDAKHGHLVETLNAMETIKSLNAHSRVQSKWEQFVGITSRVGMRARLLSSIGLNFSTFVQQSVTVFLVVYGVYLIGTGDLSVGALVACTILVGRALAPLSQAVSIYARFQQTKRSLENLNSIMKMDVERPAGKHFLPHTVVDGALKFKDVGFIYPNAPMKSLFDINLNIKKGEKIAILGRTGSGKSTLLRLMMNLYQPSSGTVFLDDLEIRQLDPAEYRKSIGYVPQNLTLFSGTLRENLLMGDAYASSQRMKDVIQKYSIMDFVKSHPMGIDLPVGEAGQKLSGGQRQLVSIARAMVKNPSLVLLDEPTSELDQATEDAVLKSLKADCADKTLVVVTHKMSVLSLVDRVIVVDGGRIVADGDKNKVLQKLQSNN